LISDIVGAFFVATEVVSQFKGNPLPSLRDSMLGQPNPFSQDYIDWEKRKYYRMKIGLTFLFLGFILQIVGVILS
jgi:hypothetical protein